MRCKEQQWLTELPGDQSDSIIELDDMNHSELDTFFGFINNNLIWHIPQINATRETHILLHSWLYIKLFIQ